MNKYLRIFIALVALIFILLQLFEVFYNKIIIAICYITITILLFIKPKGS